MRRFYIDQPSVAPGYASPERYVIELAPDEHIAGVNRTGGSTVVVVTKKQSYHRTLGIMPQIMPRGDFPVILSVFSWESRYSCLFASGEGGMRDVSLFSIGAIDSPPVIARAKRVIGLWDKIIINLGPEDYEWAPAPVEDLDPELTAREAVINNLIAVLGLPNE